MGTSEFSDLGLFTSHELSCNAHVDKITGKANKILGLVKRTCRGMKDITAQIYYCTVVWSSQTAKYITNWEKFRGEPYFEVR